MKTTPPFLPCAAKGCFVFLFRCSHQRYAFSISFEDELDFTCSFSEKTTFRAQFVSTIKTQSTMILDLYKSTNLQIGCGITKRHQRLSTGTCEPMWRPFWLCTHPLERLEIHQKFRQTNTSMCSWRCPSLRLLR